MHEADDMQRWLADRREALAQRPAYQAALLEKERRFFDKVVDEIRRRVPEAVEIWLHGSRAIGEHLRNSDWDFIAFVPTLSRERRIALHSRDGGLGSLTRVAGRTVDVEARSLDERSDLVRIVRDEGFPIWHADSHNLSS